MVLISAVLAAASIALAVLDGLRELEELRSSAYRDLLELHRSRMLVEVMTYDRSGLELLLKVRNWRDAPLDPSEIRGTSFVLASASRTLTLRYSDDQSPGTWCLNGPLRRIAAGEIFVARLHLPSPVPDGVHSLTLLFPTGLVVVRNITVQGSRVVPG